MDVIGPVIFVFLSASFVLFLWITRGGNESDRRDNGSGHYEVRRRSSQNWSEMEVSNAVRSVDPSKYVVFDNIVIGSKGNTPHTEIDHVIVSPYGIFCIETKSHKGYIYGYSNREMWRYFLGEKKYPLENPYRQNYKHTRALEDLLFGNIKAPVKSYVVFPYARKVMVDGERVDATIGGVIQKILKFNIKVYDQYELERIIKTLSFVNGKSDDLIELHKEEVQAYLRSKVA